MNDLYDAPANKDNVNDMFEEVTNILEREDAEHSDKTGHINK